ASNAIPSGFESLSRPQQSLVDIYYGGRYIMSQVATYTPDTIALRSPEELVRRIDDIAAPALITRLLSGDIINHSQDVCPPGQTQGCGRL
ncbi:hypothetical protein, partial [Sansalvadorimonas verongulae]|uniref:hypothetical protein n=1 Tax=Sansalvadorimonas verongulae TaxID=2172824 RepID=UPI0018AD1DC2